MTSIDGRLPGLVLALAGLRPGADNLHDALGPLVLAGVLLLGAAGLVAVLWYGVLGARGEAAEMVQPGFVIGLPPEGPRLIDPGVGLWAISAGLVPGLVAVVVPGRRGAPAGGAGLAQLPPPGWCPYPPAVHDGDDRAWTGHVQPR